MGKDRRRQIQKLKQSCVHGNGQQDRNNPQQRLAELREAIAERRAGVTLRDWTVGYAVTGPRPLGSHVDDTAEQTTRIRQRLLQEAREMEQELSLVAEELSNLSTRDRALREELRILEFAAVTPASIGERITAAQKDLAKFRGGRHHLEREESQAIERHATAEAAISGEQTAVKALDDARADAYLASPSAKETPTVKAAKTRLEAARELAASTRAALPQIDAQISAAQTQLATFDADCSAKLAAITRMEREHDVLKAKLVIEAATEELRSGLRDLYAADSDLALRLGNALHSEGLHVLDRDNRLQRPHWMHGWHNQGARRKVLTSTEAF